MILDSLAYKTERSRSKQTRVEYSNSNITQLNASNLKAQTTTRRSSAMICEQIASSRHRKGAQLSYARRRSLGRVFRKCGPEVEKLRPSRSQIVSIYRAMRIVEYSTAC